MSDFPLTHPSLGHDSVPSVDELMHLRSVANGTAKGDRIIRGGKVLALHTGEILERDVVIAGRHIAAVTPVGHFDAPEIIDATGQYVAPNFIDAHIHIEYTKLMPGELARLSVPKGTTTMLADANCIANVLGAEGLDIVGTTTTPMRIFRQVTPDLPGETELELGGARVPPEEIVDRVQRPNAVTLGESNPYALDRWQATKMVAALKSGKRVTGHTARLGNEPLWSYLAGGVGDDHNAVTTAEVLERLRLGAMLTLMAGSMNDNSSEVFADIPALKDGLYHICFCADDKLVEDLDREGHIDHHVRQAIRYGVEPVIAYRMASLTPALWYRLDHILGSVTPSRLADIQIIPDLREARPSVVFVGGQIVARDGMALFQNGDPIPAVMRNTINLHPDIDANSFALKAPGKTAWVQAMEMYDGYFKRAFHVELPVVDGRVQCDVKRDVLKVAIIDRHHATKTIGMGFVRGFGLKRGALAASNNCTNQNVVIVGTSDKEIAHALEVVRRIGGGMVAVAGGEVLAAIPMPLGGIMSDKPWEIVRDESLAANQAAVDIGCTMHAPYMIMSFIGLSGVPDLGLTERGLIETKTQSFMDVVLGMEGGLVCCRCPNHLGGVHGLMDPTTAGRQFVAS
jgi:adenine deaminase